MLYTSHNIGEKKLPFCCLHLTVLSNDQTEGEPEMNVLSSERERNEASAA